MPIVVCNCQLPIIDCLDEEDNVYIRAELRRWVEIAHDFTSISLNGIHILTCSYHTVWGECF